MVITQKIPQGVSKLSRDNVFIFQVGSRLQDIDSQLEPCIGELIQIQQVSCLNQRHR